MGEKEGRVVVAPGRLRWRICLEFRRMKMEVTIVSQVWYQGVDLLPVMDDPPEGRSGKRRVGR